MGRIRMTQTIPGCMDGIHPKKFVKDQEYEIDNNEINLTLAGIFLNCGAAVKVRSRQPILEAPEKAVIDKVPKTKPEKSASEMMKMDEKPEEIEADVESIIKAETKSVRVFQLSDELGISWKEIVKIANRLGIDIKKAQSGLTDSEVEKIKVAFKK